MIEVLKAGMYSGIQDTGRVGFRRYGIPPGGVMDAEAAALANRLVGNGRHAPLLECLLEGPALAFHAPAWVALTGADMQPLLAGIPAPMFCSFFVEAGETLVLGRAVSGRCTYLALRGGIRAKRHFGSCATYPLAKLGGLKGLPLERGDVLHPAASVPVRLRRAEPKSYPSAGDVTEVPFKPGPEWELLPEEARAFFLSRTFTLSASSNRAGFYFEEQIPLQQPLPERISSPTAPGCLQWTGGGQLILLMPDGPTVGGYHRAAWLSPENLWKVAQLPPGARLRFLLLQ